MIYHKMIAEKRQNFYSWNEKKKSSCWTHFLVFIKKKWPQNGWNRFRLAAKLKYLFILFTRFFFSRSRVEHDKELQINFKFVLDVCWWIHSNDRPNLHFHHHIYIHLLGWILLLLLLSSILRWIRFSFLNIWFTNNC